MTAEEKAIIRMALGWRYAEMANDLARVRSAEEGLRKVVSDLIFSCEECNSGGHVCRGCGKPISHVDTGCGEHDYHPLDVRATEYVDDGKGNVGLVPAYPCLDCLVDDEDPAPWCDCRDDERCRKDRPCRKRAHNPSRCPNRPTCGAPSTEDIWIQCNFDPHGPETMHSWQEEWVPSTWRYVRNDDRVRLGGQDAVVETTSLNDWHVDPNSNPRYPEAWEHSECLVRLSGRDQLVFDPRGPVEILMNAERQAVHRLMQAFSVQEIR